MLQRVGNGFIVQLLAGPCNNHLLKEDFARFQLLWARFYMGEPGCGFSSRDLRIALSPDSGRPFSFAFARMGLLVGVPHAPFRTLRFPLV